MPLSFVFFAFLGSISCSLLAFVSCIYTTSYPDPTWLNDYPDHAPCIPIRLTDSSQPLSKTTNTDHMCRNLGCGWGRRRGEGRGQISRFDDCRIRKNRTSRSLFHANATLKSRTRYPNFHKGHHKPYTTPLYTSRANSLTHAQTQHTGHPTGSIDRPSSVPCSCLVHKTRFLDRQGWGVGVGETPNRLRRWIKKEGVSAVSIAWLYLRASFICLQQPRQFFFRYGDEPLIGTRVVPIEEQNFLHVAVSESFDGRTCHESALSLLFSTLLFRSPFPSTVVQ